MRALRHWFLRAWPAAVLFAVSCVVHLPQLLGRRHYIRDTHRMFVPAKFFLAESIRHGELPQWWPYDGNGTPFLAQSNFSFFHPSTLAYLLLPFWKAFAAQDFIGTLLALTGAYWMARELRASVRASFVAAFLFGLNGYFTGVMEFTFTHLAVAGMPWYVAGLVAAVRRGGWWRIAPSLALAVVLFAGDPQVAILTAGAGAVLLIAVEGFSRRTLSLAILSPLAGGCLAAVQLLPSMLLVSETNRAISMLEADHWPLGVKQILGTVMPTAFGTPEFTASTFFGPVAILLLLVSLAAIKDRRVASSWGLLVVGAWLALGSGFGLNSLARALVPMWSSFRYPIKSFALVTLAIAVLGAVGFDLLRREWPARRRLVALVAGCCLAMSGLAWWAQPPSPHVWIWWTVLGAGVVAVLLPPCRGVMEWITIVLIGVPLMVEAVLVQKTVDASFYAEPPFVDVLRKAGVGSEGTTFSRFDVSEAGSQALNEGYASTVGGNGGGLNTFYHLPQMPYYTPGASLRLIGMFGLQPRPAEEFAWLTGVYGVGVLVVSPNETRWKVLGREPKFGYLAVENAGALPRAYAVQRGRPVPGFAEAEQLLKPETFARGREVLLEAEPNPAWSDRPVTPGVVMKVKRPANNRVEISGKLPWPGFAVLNETASTGWTVKVDGQSTDWLVANAMVRAVEVGAGPHQIEWLYETPGLRAGAAVSSVTLLLLLMIGLRKRREVAPEESG